jgi:hypothetical protein
MQPSVHASIPAHIPIPTLAEMLAGLANNQGGALHLAMGQADTSEVLDRFRQACLLVGPPRRISAHW